MSTGNTAISDSRHSHTRRGFTLIELLIVVGIIGVLVTVLALVVLPWISRSAETNTRTLLTTTGNLLSDTKNIRSVAQFRKDAGPLASQISSDPKVASAQLIVFYFTPSADVWQKAPLYKGTNYNPATESQQWAKFMYTDPAAPDMPHVRDAWSTPIWYEYDSASKTTLVRSAGKDQQWDTDDDLVYDGRSGRVRLWSEIKK